MLQGLQGNSPKDILRFRDRLPNNSQHASTIRIAAILVLSAFAMQAQAQIIAVDSAAQTDSLAATNGNKVAASEGRLHMVYAKGGAIYYSSSASSLTWTAGVPLPGTTGSGASQPTIAAAADGTVGVVYRDGGSSLY